MANVHFFPSACLVQSSRHAANSVTLNPPGNLYSAACIIRVFSLFLQPHWHLLNVCKPLLSHILTLISWIQATFYYRFRARILLNPVCGPDRSATVLLLTHTGHAAAPTSGCSTFWPPVFPLGCLKIKYYRLKGKFKQIGILCLETLRGKTKEMVNLKSNDSFYRALKSVGFVFRVRQNKTVQKY